MSEGKKSLLSEFFNPISTGGGSIRPRAHFFLCYFACVAPRCIKIRDFSQNLVLCRVKIIFASINPREQLSTEMFRSLCNDFCGFFISCSLPSHFGGSFSDRKRPKSTFMHFKSLICLDSRFNLRYKRAPYVKG